MNSELDQAIIDATPDELAAEPDLAHLLWRVQEADPEGGDAAVALWLEHDAILLTYIKCFQQIDPSGGTAPQLSVDQLVAHRSLGWFDQRIDRLTAPPSDERGQQALADLRRAIAEARSAGQGPAPGPP